MTTGWLPLVPKGLKEMSVLGIVIRVHPRHLEAIKQRLAGTAGVDLAPDAGDGRLAAVIESTATDPAAAIMAELTHWPEVLNLSLVFEQSDDEHDPDAPEFDFRAWRQDVGDFARRQAAQAPRSVSPASTGAAEGAGEAR